MAPSVNVQANYTERMRAGVAGMVQGSDFNSDTGICETAAGIGFGLAVSQGTGDKGVVIGGTRLGFRGITIRDVTLVHSDANLDKYIENENMGILTRGKIMVATTVPVAAGDAVYFVAATGVLTNVSAGNQGPINGARFIRSAAGNGDVAIVELSGYQRSA